MARIAGVDIPRDKRIEIALTYVYGIGGYKFSDFVRIGVPLNLLCFAVAMLVIPRVWPL